MPFFTRPELTDDQFKQLTTSILTLSGETNFAGTLKSKGVEIDATISGGTLTGFTLTLDSDGVIKLKPASSGGSGIYSGATPSTVTVGGIAAGTNLGGRTFESLFEEMLVVYQAPTFSNFNINISSLNEVGNPTSWSGNRTFTWTTTNGGNVQSNTILIRDVTNSIILGSGLANDGTEVLSLGTLINNVIPISQTWRIEGTNTNLNAMTPRTTTITSIYPWFYGTFNAGAVPAGSNRPDASIPATAQSLVNAGTKVVATSNGTIIPNFGSSNQDYIWVAVPNTSTLKTIWYVNALNNGIIGGSVSAGGNLFPTPVTVNIDSPSGYWGGISYKFYVSNKQTAATVMEFRNS